MGRCDGKKRGFLKKKICLGEEAGFGVRVVGYCHGGTSCVCEDFPSFFFFFLFFFWYAYHCRSQQRLATQMTDITTLY